MDGLRYWWKAGPGPYARRMLVGLGWGILIIIAIGGLVALFDASLDLAARIADAIDGDTVAVWFGMFAGVVIIALSIAFQFNKNPIERRKQPGDDRYGAEYDPYNREDDDFDEETLEFKPQKTRHVGIYQSQVNTKDSSQKVE